MAIPSHLSFNSFGGLKKRPYKEAEKLSWTIHHRFNTFCLFRLDLQKCANQSPAFNYHASFDNGIMADLQVEQLLADDGIQQFPKYLVEIITHGQAVVVFDGPEDYLTSNRQNYDTICGPLSSFAHDSRGPSPDLSCD